MNSHNIKHTHSSDEAIKHQIILFCTHTCSFYSLSHRDQDQDHGPGEACSPVFVFDGAHTDLSFYFEIGL